MMWNGSTVWPTVFWLGHEKLQNFYSDKERISYKTNLKEILPYIL